MNFQAFRAGTEKYKLRFFVGHDGTMIRVASALGLGKLAPLRWPALGSEIVMEVGPYPVSVKCIARLISASIVGLGV